MAKGFADPLGFGDALEDLHHQTHEYNRGSQGHRADPFYGNGQVNVMAVEWERYTFKDDQK